MDKFKFGLFDIFTYTLPGLVFMLSLFLCYYDTDFSLVATTKNIFTLINTLSFPSIVFLFILSYLIGFILYSVSYQYFKYIGKRIWTIKINREMKSLTNHDLGLVLARHYSKENFNYVELWYAFRGMSFNLSLAFLFLTAVLIFKVLNNSTYQKDWLILTITCLCSSVILLAIAVKFHIWSHNTLFETAMFLNEDNVTHINNISQ